MYCAGADLNIADINAGDFIELEGELQDNPMIDMMENNRHFFRKARQPKRQMKILLLNR